MPNGRAHKEYGNHKYGNPMGNPNCDYGCGCWMGRYNSGGPAGLDPFGTCPGNPLDGQSLDGNTDYEYVVTERIEELESRAKEAEKRAEEAEERLKRVRPSKVKLAEEVASLKATLAEANGLLTKIHDMIGAYKQE